MRHSKFFFSSGSTGLLPFFLMLFILFFSSCNVPRDPENSFEEAVSEKLLVGVTNYPPFVNFKNDSLTGSEVDLIKKFARKENMELKFFRGSESELVRKLEKFELHVVLGGFEKDTHWKSLAGVTTPYDGKHVLLIPKGENKLLQHLETFIFNERKK